MRKVKSQKIFYKNNENLNLSDSCFFGKGKKTFWDTKEHNS